MWPKILHDKLNLFFKKLQEKALPKERLEALETELKSRVEAVKSSERMMIDFRNQFSKRLQVLIADLLRGGETAAAATGKAGRVFGRPGDTTDSICFIFTLFS